MAQGTTQSNVASLQTPSEAGSRGYWADAWVRLIRNRMAVLGLIIIVINVILAVFAPLVAIEGINDQDREEADAAPIWIINLLNLSPRDEEWRLRSGTPEVVTGQLVKEGDLLVTDIDDDEDLYANMDGTVFVTSSRIYLTPMEVPVYSLEGATDLRVAQDLVVREGDLLFTDSSGQPVTASVGGTLFVDDTHVYVRPLNSGYTPLRNEYPLGNDYLGRDLWTRIVFGARVSLLVALIGPLVSIVVGLPYGLISGYFGGAIDNWMMRFVDLMYAFPTLLLIILLMAFFRSSAAATQQDTFIGQMGNIDRASGGMFFIFLGTGLTSWMGLARLTRGQVLSVREQEYVLAAKSIGSSTPMIMWRHILPNILGPIIISETLTIPTYIRYEAFLSFIGLGVNPPTPSWGNMISDGSRVLRTAPHEAIFPALALFLIMFAFNFLGDGLRDALDPRLRGVE